MNSKFFKQLSFLILFLFYGTVHANQSQNNSKFTTLRFIKQHLDIKLELANTELERQHGLMFRHSLDANSGMLFIYKDTAPRSIWMKNTLLPLDVLFLAYDGTIVAAFNDLQPCLVEPCPIYNSVKPAMYILELNSHFMQHYQIKIGEKLLLPKTL